ncbi:VWA domain-containing protein [Dehalococcoidales bacterium]|nr:VWA domain-containing protein [Dehalococcoidales bacterium]
MSEKGVETTKHGTDNRITISQHGVEIRHEGKPISIRVTGIGDVYLVVDCSESMAGDKLSQAKKGALDFAKDALAKGYSVGLIQFHSSAIHLCQPLGGIWVLDSYLKEIKTGGDGTHMAKAIRLAHQQLKERRVGARVMVIVTDGMPNGPYDPEASLYAGENAKKDGIDIIAIGTDDADREFLKKLASRTELGIKVAREQFEQGIASSAKMLPARAETKLNKKTG